MVVNALNDSSGDGRRPFEVIISACHSFIFSSVLFRCSFITRVGNALAHALAHISFLDTDVLVGDFSPADLTHLI